MNTLGLKLFNDGNDGCYRFEIEWGHCIDEFERPDL